LSQEPFCLIENWCEDFWKIFWRNNFSFHIPNRFSKDCSEMLDRLAYALTRRFFLF
jgi:hypothetical protein